MYLFICDQFCDRGKLVSVSKMASDSDSATGMMGEEVCPALGQPTHCGDGQPGLLAPNLSMQAVVRVDGDTASRNNVLGVGEGTPGGGGTENLGEKGTHGGEGAEDLGVEGAPGGGGMGVMLPGPSGESGAHGGAMSVVESVAATDVCVKIFVVLFYF